jgi:NodT family efflux transporter outer membrane factor (OMF) lipoprotein
VPSPHPLLRRRRSTSATLATLLPLFVLAGCAVGPEPRAPVPEQLGVPERFATPLTSSAVAVDLARWWQAFDDATLTQLVERALAANTDIEVAGARVRQARAAQAAQRGLLWPRLGASTSATRTESDSASIADDRTTWRAGFDASYEVDLFGGLRRGLQAAAADAQSAEAQLRTVQLAIAGEVALNYVEARLAQRRLEIARANLAAQDETLQIVGWRVQAGLVGVLDLELARQLRARTAATIPSLEQNRALALNRLAVLVAEPPGALDALLGAAADVPLAPVPDAPIPADVLRRRPDVAAAERSLVAEIARIGVREADLYPALRLTGTLAGIGTSFGDATDAAIGSVAAGIAAPIFEGGRLRAALEAQRAAAAGALSDYRGTVLIALEDTENALLAVDVNARSEAELIVAEDAARNAATLARSQYQAGLIDFQALLESERSLLSSGDARASARAGRATASIQLFKALGGGWESAPEPRTLTATP